VFSRKKLGFVYPRLVVIIIASVLATDSVKPLPVIHLSCTASKDWFIASIYSSAVCPVAKTATSSAKAMVVELDMPGKFS